MKKYFKIIFLSLLSLLTMLFTHGTANADGVKELTNVITSVELLNASDTPQTTDSEGVYQVRTDLAYKLRVLFDLKNYNGNLSNGDYFTFNIPAPMDVYNGTLELTDPSTRVPIADAVVTKNGVANGGTVKVTLKNLEQYLAATGGDVVKDVSGNFAATFKYNSDVTKKAQPYVSNAMKNQVTHLFTSKTIQGTVEGYENFAKAGGQVSNEAWESPKLAAINSPSSGDYYSAWRVRVNTGGQDLGPNVVVNDSLPTDSKYAAIQYIPESLRVYSAPSLNAGTSAAGRDFVLLTEGTDYTVKWNANYTTLDITLVDGTKKYWIEYKTTTPNDGQKVANTLSVTDATGTQLTQRSNNTRTSMTAEATSLYSGTIVAATAYRIKINKTDAFNFSPVNGAVYTITAEDGSTQEVTTDAKGVAITAEYAQSFAGKTFTIKEKTAPQGYKLDPKEYKVVLGAAGSTVNLKDEPVPATLDIVAKKNLTGRALENEEFTFNLYDSEDNLVGTAKNTQDGTITFTGVEFKSAGTYNYSISEVKGSAKGVTYDTEKKPVVVKVTTENGALKATVTSDAVTFNNTFEKPSVKVALNANKTLAGRDLKAEEFSFQLIDGATSNVLQTKTNANTGTVTFDELTIEAAGTYKYQIKEVKGSLAGVTYDESTVEATVVVSETAEGKLQAKVTYSNEDNTFENSYQAAPATAEFKVTKKMTGKALADGDFEFTLTDPDGQEVQTKTNKANGEVSFDAVSFTKAGTFNYTIKEKNTAKAGVTYDASVVTAIVTVTDDGNGQLQAAVEYKDGDSTFENSYAAKSSKAQFVVTKELAGRTLKDGEFSFDLKDENGAVLQTKQNTAAGTVTFDEISYDAAGTYNYKIVEKEGSLAGVTYDKSEKSVTVTVTDDGNGQLTAAVKYANDDTTFKNSYKAGQAKAMFEITKVLNGRDLQAEEFEFELVNNNNEVVATAKNNAAGAVSFEQSFNEAGEYTFTIREVKGTKGGIEYDTTQVTATVKVTDDGNGQLQATVEYKDGDQKFENKYTAAAVKLNIPLKKELTGRDLREGEFDFALVDTTTGTTVANAKNVATGEVIFKDVVFEKAGTYKFIVKETKGSDETITYDESELELVVEVTDNGEGQLVATATFVNGETFTNTFTPPVVPNPEVPTTTTTSEEPSTSTTEGQSGLPNTGQASTFVTTFLAFLALLAAGGLTFKIAKDKK